MRAIIVLLLVAVAYADRWDPMINEGLFEGDILGIDPNADRSAVPRDSQRWTNGVVPYLLDPTLDDQRDLVLESMRHIEERSCIRFVPRTNERNYIRIYKGPGCFSSWGMINAGEQRLSLGKGCYYLGVVVHELLHALGFQHEHSRNDRDDYLTIHWENIDRRNYGNFMKLQPHQARPLTAFDYDSIMLYGEKAFAKAWGLKAMSAKDGRFLEEAYYKPGMSTIDVQRLKMLYQCEK